MLLAICLVISQLYPCDSTVSITNGDSVILIVMTFGISFFLAMDDVLSACGFGSRASDSKPVELFGYWIAGLCLLFCGWLWICTTRQSGIGNARFATNGFWQWTAQLVLLLSIAKLSSSPKVVSSLISLMLACVAGTIGFALFQYFVTMPNLRHSFAADPNAMLAKLGYSADSSNAILYMNRLASLEPTGPFILTNSLAGFLAAWLVLLTALLWNRIAFARADVINPESQTKRWKDWVLPTLGVVLGISLCVTLFLTKSRTAWLATAMGFIALCVAHRVFRNECSRWVQRHRLVAGGVALMIGVGSIVLVIRDPLLIAEAGKSLSYRFDYWRGAMSLIMDSPFSGFGVGSFQANYNRVKLITASESPADPHNFLLETACAGGVPLLIVLSLILGMLIWTLFRRANAGATCGSETGCSASDKCESVSISLGVMCAFMGALAYHFFTSDDELFYSVLTFVGLGTTTYFCLERFEWKVGDSSIRIACMVAAFVMLVHLCASGGWMLPGTMNSVCVLAGIGIGSSRASMMGSAPKRGLRSRAQLFRAIILLLLLLAVVEFTRTMCLPILRKSEKLATFTDASNQVHSIEEWRELEAADVWDPELPRMFANECVHVLGRRNLSTTEKNRWIRAFDESAQEYLRRDPNNWISATECGRWNSMLAELDLSFASRKELANKHFRRAATLYPSAISTQLQAAVSSKWCNDSQTCQDFLARVDEIDRATTHADRRLSASLVFFPPQLERSLAPLELSARKNMEVGMARGEPVMRWLRTNANDRVEP